MKNINYALAGGNKVLLQGQCDGNGVLFQLWYQNVVDADVQIKVGISTNADGPYAEIPEAAKTIVPTEGTLYMSLSGLTYGYLQFTVVAGNGTVGTITRVDAIGLTEAV